MKGDAFHGVVWLYTYVYTYKLNVYMFERVDISMVVICYASDVIEYDRRRSELSNAPLRMEQGTNIIEI